MSTKVAVGTSKHKDNGTAGQEAASIALKDLGGKKPDFALVFGTTGYDQQKLLEGVASVVGNLPMTGCSGEGVITKNGSDESSHAVSVMLFSSDKMKFHNFLVEGLKADSAKVAKKLADQLKTHDTKTSKVLMIFPDGITANNSLLLETLDANLPFPVKIVGGTSADMWNLQKTYQYHNGKVFSDSMSAVLIDGALLAEVTVGHGCEPIGLERTVTKAKENWIHELDGISAWSAFKEYLDGDPQELLFADLVHLCIGEQLPEKDASQYDKYIIRTPLGLNKEEGALFFPAEIKTGTKVKMTRRDPEKIGKNVRELASRMASQHPGKKPFAVVHMDCAGRGKVLLGERINKSLIQPFQDALGHDTPWIGFHCYGEIAPLGKKTYFHNYTVVLCAFYEA